MITRSNSLDYKLGLLNKKFVFILSLFQNLAAWWIVSCVAISVFPMLPVVGRSSDYILV